MRLIPGVARCPGPSTREIIERDPVRAPAPITEESYAFLGDADVPFARYTSKAFFEKEAERLWPRVWQWACREEHIPRPGDYIVYEAGTSRLHREHIILHEVGHLLSDHGTTTVLEPRTSRALLPSLDPDLVDRVLGRTHYSAAEEQEAELIASLILERASRWQLASDWASPEDTTGIRQRLGGALERPEHPDRR